MTLQKNGIEEHSSGLIQVRNGHIEYHIGNRQYGLKNNALLMLGTKGNDGYYFLQLDAFDILSLIQTLFKPLSEEQKTNLLKTLGNSG